MAFIKDVLKKSKDFFKKNYKEINKKYNAKKIMSKMKKEHSTSKSSIDFKPGDLLHYEYKAKWAKQLYDKKPLIICLGRPKKKHLYSTHFYGLNLHHMPVEERVSVATFFIELRKKKNNELVYEDVKPWLNRYKKRGKILRMYIIKNVSPKVVKFPDENTDEFIVVSALRTEKFIWSS